MAELKKERLLRELKNQILSSPGGVTRSTAAQHLLVDLRTAGGYLEELTAAGFTVKKNAETGGRGRPGLRYISAREHLSFLGISISHGLQLEAILIDFQGTVLAKKNIMLTERPSILSVFTAVLHLAKDIHDTPEYRLFGIGLAISRWLQPPLSRDDLYCTLAEALRRELGIPVCRDVNINAAAYAYACEQKIRNLAVIHAGLVMEFGLIRSGEPDLNFAERENWLSHLCVNPEGRRCYCGRRGCLANYVTTDILRERLETGSENPAERKKQIQSISEMLGEGILKTAWEYPELEFMAVYCNPNLIPDTGKFCLMHNPRPQNLAIVFPSRMPSVALGAAREAAFFELNRYMNL